MKRRTRKKRAKAPTKAQLRCMVEGLTRENAAYTAAMDERNETIAEMRQTIARHTETTARALAVLKEIAPAIYVRGEDTRRPGVLPDYMVGGRVWVPGRAHLRLWQPTDLPDGVVELPAIEAFVHRLSLAVREHPIDKGTLFEFRNSPLCAGSTVNGSAVQVFVSDVLLRGSRLPVRIIFEEMVEELWAHFVKWLDQQKGIKV